MAEALLQDRKRAVSLATIHFHGWGKRAKMWHRKRVKL